MSQDWSAMSAGKLRTFRENYERADKTATDDYRIILERLTFLQRGLDVETTRNYVISAAKKHQFVAYSEIAKLYGLDWSKVRFKMNEHLEHLCDDSYRRDGVLLSAIVVNAQNTANGRLDLDALADFVAYARKFMVIPTGEEQRVLLAEQHKVFARYESENFV